MMNSNLFGSGSMQRAFTLVEIAVVVVIIGLIIGGIFVGNDLIREASIRAQLAQIEKYNAAVNTFKVKYNYLPGDLPEPHRASVGFNFTPDSFCRATNGDGKIGRDGMQDQYCAEYILFWSDMHKAGLIGEMGRAVANDTGAGTVYGDVISRYVVKAKLGGNRYVYVWRDGLKLTLSYDSEAWGNNYSAKDGRAYLAIAGFTRFRQKHMDPDAINVAVIDAYNMDKKIDDGMPQSGRVLAGFVGTAYGDPGHVIWSPNAVSGSSTTCFDNQGNAANPATYSLGQNSGENMTCGISFKLQY